MSYVNNIPTFEDPDLSVEKNNKFISAFVGNNTYHTEPFGDISYPVVNNITEDLTLDSRQ